MSEHGKRILQHLAAVNAERALRTTSGDLAERVAEVKRYQHARFTHTYEDLFGQPGYAAAANFFLDELYGPVDFSKRDHQFERIVPALVRLFPADVVKTVGLLAELHALSERLDTRMGQGSGGAALDEAAYASVWRRTGEPAQRERQIELMLAVGHALWRHTKKPLLRHSLRLMRVPAEAAGLSDLQHFLETGFDAFRKMPDPGAFLGLVSERERRLVAQLFGA